MLSIAHGIPCGCFPQAPWRPPSVGSEIRGSYRIVLRFEKNASSQI
jgi:hypothetical protein